MLMNITSYLRRSNRFYFAAFFIALFALAAGVKLFQIPGLEYLAEHNRIFNILGIFSILGICVGLSKNRAAINIKLVSYGMLMHLCLALVVLKTSLGQTVIGAIADSFTKLYEAAGHGIQFLFGNLSAANQPWGFIFAIKVLPVIIFFGAFMSLLFYFGIVQKIVAGLGKLLQPILGTSGAETLCAVANSFLGQTEAPLLVRHYLNNMTKSEFLVVMISGMGTISGAILAVFAAMGVPAKHLLASSVMAIPATLIIAKILYPETEQPETAYGSSKGAEVETPQAAGNALDAISHGTSDGLQLALNVGAMLIAFLALLGLLNSMLGFSCVQLQNLFQFMGIAVTVPVISLNDIFAFICMPFSWLLGFTGLEAWHVGQLLGTKVAVNELVAYGNMLTMGLTERTAAIVTYALCGFSNFSCIGIQIGGIGALVPEKRAWLSEFGLLAVLGGALANLLSAMVASLLL